MIPRAVLFDLDGTLLDTLADIASAANAALAAEGLPPRSPDDYRRFIGDGVVNLFRRALPADRVEADRVDRCAAAFADHYERTWDRGVGAYDGIPELLDALTARGIAMAVLSNKRDDFTKRCVAHYLPRWHFHPVLGQREGVPRKPDPTSALEIAEVLNIPPAAFVYLGDTDVDVTTARRAGMRPLGAGWGFRTADELRSAGAEAVIGRPLDLLAFLESAATVPDR